MEVKREWHEQIQVMPFIHPQKAMNPPIIEAMESASKTRPKEQKVRKSKPTAHAQEFYSAYEDLIIMEFMSNRLFYQKNNVWHEEKKKLEERMQRSWEGIADRYKRFVRYLKPQEITLIREVSVSDPKHFYIHFDPSPTTKNKDAKKFKTVLKIKPCIRPKRKKNPLSQPPRALDEKKLKAEDHSLIQCKHLKSEAGQVTLPPVAPLPAEYPPKMPCIMPFELINHFGLNFLPVPDPERTTWAADEDELIRKGIGNDALMRLIIFTKGTEMVHKRLQYLLMNHMA